MRASASTSAPATLPRGFTLVELLAAIAIVTLLVAVLLPALGRARESARQRVCQSNLRQIATAGLLHQTELDRLPGMLPGYGGWVFDLAPFLGGIGSEAAGNDRPVWFCPSTRRQSPAFSPYNLTTYAINRNLIRHPGTQHPRHLQSDQLPALSRTAFFLDGTLIAGEGADIELDPAQLNLAIASWAGNAALHGGRFNVAFLDGHLAAVPLERLINATSSGEIWALEPVAD